MSVLNEFLGTIPAEQHALVRALDSVIKKAAPALAASLKWGNLTYSGRKTVCSIVSHKHHLNLQVWGAASLSDPRVLLIGTGKDMRHIKVVKQADVDSKYVAQLVKQAARLGGT